ncbi:MAG: MBL fold metallo-hydrolase [Clostridia bacterium]|nr:MBL fold metallo-hydrolase [Clostridia bacterium]
MAEFYLLGNSTYSQMFGCVIITESKTIVIDGGSQGDRDQLYSFLTEKSQGHVDAWFFTHAHHDHIGAFCELCYKYPQVEVDKIYYDFPTFDKLKELGSRGDWEISLWNRTEELFSNRFDKSLFRVKKDDKFVFDDVEITVLRAFNKDITRNFVNNSSVVYRIDGKKSSILILGDLGEEGGDEVMASCKRELLFADYTQMAHHGQRGVKKEFYEYIMPKKCIWASPEWLWNNDKGGGYDTGPWYTVRTREWVEALGVKEHIIEKDGIQKIKI